VSGYLFAHDRSTHVSSAEEALNVSSTLLQTAEPTFHVGNERARPLLSRYAGCNRRTVLVRNVHVTYRQTPGNEESAEQ
jgi:hypothetical protein